MKKDIRGPICAVILLLALGCGVYWGVAVSPKKERFWTNVKSVARVTGARIDMDGKSVTIEKADALRIFEQMRLSPNYSPNHPATIRKGKITFHTNIGEITFSLLDTSNQGVLLWAFSSGDSGWNYGTRRCDEIIDYLPIMNDIQEAPPSPP